MATEEEYFAFKDFAKVEEEKASAVTEEKPLGPCVIYQGRKNYLQHHHEEWNRAKADDKEKSVFKRKLIQEVRALSARWLRMQNVCILTGAGTSLCAGGLEGNELAPRTKELLNLSGGRPSLQLLNQLLSLCDEKNLNFEDFLSYLCAVRRCIEPSKKSFARPVQVSLSLDGKNTRITIEELDELIDDIERAVAISCNLLLADQPTVEKSADMRLSAHLVFVGKILSRDPTLGRVKLVTSNYDTLFEQAMDRLNVYYADGFTGTVDRHFNPACFGLDYYYPGEVAEGRVRRYDKYLHLYKLHGSITWRKTRPDTNNPFGLSFSSDPVPSFNKVKENPELFKSVLPKPSASEQDRLGLGILPTSSKYGETITMPYAHLFRAFAHALLEPQTVCFVLGYSGWDEHINRLIEDALSNPSFTLVVVDPFVSSWVGRLLRSDRCERVYCISGDWGQFHKFVDELLPDVEQLKTQMEVAKTLRQLQSNVTEEQKIDKRQNG
jgi:hypothetical protein